MKYENIVKGFFISRPNRFIANVTINGEEHRVHVKNTGRCKELLEKGNMVYLEDFTGRMGTRKMTYSLINVVKNYCNHSKNMLINMDSQAPNKVVKEALLGASILLPGMDQLTIVKAEQKYKNSRFDFYVEDINGKKAFIEVKGVTLEKDGIAYFPDAPTARGTKHLHQLIDALTEGYGAYVILVIQIEDINLFRPNKDTDPAFAESIKMASKNGVKILAYNCNVTEDTLAIANKMDIELDW